MSNITSQNRIARQLDGLTENTEGLSMLQHFDYPETWSYEGNTCLSSDAKFGKRCAYFPDITSKAVVTNTTGLFSMSPFGNYEAECFVEHGYPMTIIYQDFSGLIYEQRGDYYLYNGHTFKFFADSKTWVEAKSACEALGGHLATSTSAEKNDFLTSLASGSWTAIGGQKIEDAWSWVTGETWNYTNWRSNSPSNGENELYLFMNSSGEWDDNTASFSAPYICEWDFDTTPIMDFGGLTLSLDFECKLQLTSNTWNIEKTSDTRLTANEWHHILFRVTGGYAYVFVDGVQLLRAGITGSSTIAPESVKLGGYVGYLDEFVFRHNAGTEPPTVPESAYEMGVSFLERIPTVNAPVTRVAWSAEGLPEGVTLSESGVLTGHPTTAGTYDSTITITTNWGTATRTVRIFVN